MCSVDIPAIKFDQIKTNKVIEELYEISKQDKKTLRRKEFKLEDGQIWTSWTMRESVYKKEADSFPTMARGIFTEQLTSGQYQVVVRGYDKFFNICETKFTQWPAIKSETTGPYEVTSKENGCIIFIVAVSEEKIVVTSKHSIPAIKTDINAHGGVGYNWVLKHLSSTEKSEKDLATWLYNKNVTLVAELCDDEFEQHILPYTDRDRGLYLHGINYNSTDIYTLPSSTVQQVADEFGFHKVNFDVVESIDEIKILGDKVQMTGIYRGKEVEGVVIRCKRDGKDFMFKIKSEPYLVYREYREITNAIIKVSDHDDITLDLEKNLKIQYEKTRFYISWLTKRVVDKPEWFKNYKLHKGIIDVRQEFEKYWERGDFDA